MKFLYVAPRYHTNQANIMKGLIERGDEVCFISHYKAIIEDYSYIEPVVLGYSFWYRIIDFLYMKVIYRNDPAAAGFKIQHGFPPIFKLAKTMKNFNPDLVIVREKSVYSIVTYLICKKRDYPCILYNQKPMWSEPEKTDLAHRIVSRLSPAMRMTPVMGTQGAGTSVKPNDFFVPFVVEPQVPPEKKTYFMDGRIHIFYAGKYIVRKHHLELLEAVRKLKDKYPLYLTLAGEVTTRFQKEYLARVEDYVKKYHMESYVEIKTNVPRTDMDAEYSKADIYIIPSTDEPASVSQLEAMSFSLPVICSGANGTACYVEDGVTGYLFRDCSQEDLEKKMDMLLSDKERLLAMGAAGYRAVVGKYGFGRYYDGIMEIWKKIKADEEIS